MIDIMIRSTFASLGVAGLLRPIVRDKVPGHI